MTVWLTLRAGEETSGPCCKDVLSQSTADVVRLSEHLGKVWISAEVKRDGCLSWPIRDEDEIICDRDSASTPTRSLLMYIA